MGFENNPYSYYDLSELPQGDLPENTEISWYVLAHNQSGTTKFPSSNWIFTTGTYAPSTPTIVTPSNGDRDLDSENTTLDWSDSDHTDSYTLYFREKGATSWDAYSGISSSQYSVSSLNLTSDSEYEWYVEAVNSNHSSPSTESSFFTEITTVPADPSNISVSASGPWSVKVSWDDNAGNEYRYYLEARRRDRFTGWTDWVLECTLNPNATEKYINQVIGPIEFRIWASNEVGDSSKVYSDTYVP